MSISAGQTHNIRFQLTHNFKNAENDFSVHFSGETVCSIVNVASFYWTPVTQQAAATSSSTALTILVRDVPAWFSVSDVFVSTGAPELSPRAMMFIGFAGAGFAGYRASRGGASVAA